MEIIKNTRAKLRPSDSSLKIPTADSVARMVTTIAWTVAGSARSLVGSGGRPSEIDDRDKNTDVWYTSCKES